MKCEFSRSTSRPTCAYISNPSLRNFGGSWDMPRPRPSIQLYACAPGEELLKQHSIGQLQEQQDRHGSALATSIDSYHAYTSSI